MNEITLTDDHSLFNGTSLLDYFRASYADLVRVLGEPNDKGDEYKVSTEWHVLYKRQPFSIYDYKMTELYDDETTTVEQFRELPSYDWHIGGHRGSDVDGFIAALAVALATVDPW